MGDGRAEGDSYPWRSVYRRRGEDSGHALPSCNVSDRRAQTRRRRAGPHDVCATWPHTQPYSAIGWYSANPGGARGLILRRERRACFSNSEEDVDAQRPCQPCLASPPSLPMAVYARMVSEDKDRLGRCLRTCAHAGIGRGSICRLCVCASVSLFLIADNESVCI